MNEYPLAYACFNKDIGIRMRSTSGGVFTVFADYVIQNLNGVVFGAAFVNDYSVKHICVDSLDNLDKLRGSKYPQSFVGNTYREVEEYLKKGTYVLFSGTPCQVGALLNYLGKSYDNLICMDFVCHGVASTGVWHDYVKNLQKRGRIKKIIFKDKFKSWKKWYFCVEYENCIKRSRGTLNTFMKSYLCYCNIRPSCYECNFKGLKRISDFTISDCWGIGEQNKTLNDDRGLSALLIQNEKALSVFNEVKNKLIYQKYPAKELMHGNWTAEKSVKPAWNRKLFFDKVAEDGGNEALDYYFRPSKKEKLYYYYQRFKGVEK